MKNFFKLLLLITITTFNFIFYPNDLLAQRTTPPGSTAELKLYKPDKAYNGYTYFSIMDPFNPRTILVDMEGKEVHSWPLGGVPSKMLPGGSLIGAQGISISGVDAISVVQVGWDGEVEWKFNRLEEVTNVDGNKVWAARQHHDLQREGNPVGYYAPGLEPLVDGGKTLILAHSTVQAKEISDNMLTDDVIYEVDWKGNIIKKENGGFFWRASDHFDEMGFDDAAKEDIRRTASRGRRAVGAGVDWLHTNSASYLGPNKWFDGGDERFHPENVIMDSRNANFIAIISRKTGEIVWRVGPDFSPGNPEHKLGQIIGQHHAHMIPKGLPGEGNILVLDNGGIGGYGDSKLRAYSRVLEFNPVTMEIVWEYSDRTGLDLPFSRKNQRFFTPFIGSAQRLPNGNTLITEGATGTLIEVTKDKEIVWEYISPYVASVAQVLPVPLPAPPIINAVYRAYRVPEDWLPANWNR